MKNNPIMPQSLSFIITSPLEQFQIQSIIPLTGPFQLDFSITNSALITFLAIIIFIAFTQLSLHHQTLVPNNTQSILEILYEQTSTMVLENMGTSGRKFFPLAFTTFTLILLLNLFGLIPYVFSVTAHIIITFGFSLAIWIAVTLLGLSNFKLQFLSMFMPPGSPIILAPLLVFIELLSYTARAISLGVRLAANITSGHILLAIISGFAWKMFTFGGILTLMSFFPVLILLFLSALELAVAFIQAYVFTLLTCIYLNDGLHLH